MRKAIVILFVLTTSTSVFAQWGNSEVDEETEWKNRFFTGGELGLSFSSNYDYVSVSPMLGYNITPKLAGGLQIQYRYQNYKAYTPKIETHNYGVSPFVRMLVYNPVFLHAEYEYLNYEYFTSPTESVRKGFSSFQAGGGYFQSTGERAGFYIMALYNFSYSSSTSLTTPIDSPFSIRVGFTAGL